MEELVEWLLLIDGSPMDDIVDAGRRSDPALGSVPGGSFPPPPLTSEALWSISSSFFNGIVRSTRSLPVVDGGRGGGGVGGGGGSGSSRLSEGDVGGGGSGKFDRIEDSDTDGGGGSGK